MLWSSQEFTVPQAATSLSIWQTPTHLWRSFTFISSEKPAPDNHSLLKGLLLFTHLNICQNIYRLLLFLSYIYIYIYSYKIYTLITIFFARLWDSQEQKLNLSSGIYLYMFVEQVDRSLFLLFQASIPKPSSGRTPFQGWLFTVPGWVFSLIESRQAFC